MGVCMPRYAVFADIHGNYPALRAALTDADNRGVDGYLFVGDYCFALPYENEVANTLRTLPNARLIAGNGEDYVHWLASRDPSTFTDGQFTCLYYQYQALTPQNKEFLMNLPERDTLNTGHNQCNIPIHMCHWNGHRFPDTAFNQITSGRMCKHLQSGQSHSSFLEQKVASLADDQRLADMLPDTPAIYLDGHNHIQYHAFIGNTLFLNPGSCGDPLDGIHGAPYTIIDITDTVTVSEHRAVYDIDSLIDYTRASDLYKAAPELTEVVLRSLKTSTDTTSIFFACMNEYAERIGDSTRPFQTDTWRGGFKYWLECVGAID